MDEPGALVASLQTTDRFSVLVFRDLRWRNHCGWLAGGRPASRRSTDWCGYGPTFRTVPKMVASGARLRRRLERPTAGHVAVAIVWYER